ncbi:tape measure protein [Erythrobacter sp. SCSIO 43205]|uniref:tape measure protein n=1 Tax=Erythrobacter sp. SCSIO 43205 TaxID=2779361 RepID=UPI001CAA0301|nr:tape measure protein [Erythrobacter sp. SCSIO 43205]UAB76952.1 tape measure protein [Erythrobacter sp. SCSIO 43205]
MDRYQAELRSATRTVDQQLGRQESRVRKLESEFRRSSSSIAIGVKSLAATLATAFTGRELAALADNFTRLQNQLRVAGLEGERLTVVQGRLLELAQKYGVSINGLAELYGKATDAGRSFNASEEQVLRLTEATSQALLITGTSATQAQGAILGLSQALASGTVRAEEYSQINEGGLRPLLQAAAASERFGGDVNKLRAAMLDGTVTSEEFFNSILSGSSQLDERASKATITLSGAVEGLTSALTVYVGEADAATGTSEALAAGINALADNLDVLIPLIAIVATGLGVGYVSNLVRARLATVALGAAATATGRALLTAFGGPVGLAISAVAVGLAYVATEANSAQQRIDQLNRSADTAAKEADEMEAKLREAGVAMDSVGIASDTAKDGIDGVTGAAKTAKGELYALQQQAIRTAVALVDLDITENNRRRVANNRARNSPELNQTASGLARQRNGDTRRGSLDREAEAIDNEFRQLTRKRNAIIAGVINGVDFNAGGPPTSPTGTSPTTSSGGGSRTTITDPAEVLRRFYEDQRRADEEILQAKLALATSAEERADLERDILESQANARRDEVNSNKDLTEEQRKALLDQIDALYGVEAQIDEQGNIIASGNRGLLGQAIAFREQAEIEQRNRDLAEERGRAQLDALRLEFDLADTERERRDIAQRLLSAEDDLLRSRLESIIASNTALEADKERARVARDALDATAEDRREQINRQFASPLERYGIDAKDTETRVEEAAVRRIERLNETITDAMTNALGIEDPFLRDLIGIFLDKNVFGPLAEALAGQEGGFGSGGFGGVLSAIGGLFGRSSGGFVQSGRPYRVNEGAAPGRVEAFVPQGSGQIIPLGRMNALQSGGVQPGGVVRVMIEEAPGFAARVRTEATGVAVEVQRQTAPTIIDAAANETLRRAQRPSI